jgi:octaprenyl-diphosphate synthase
MAVSTPSLREPEREGLATNEAWNEVVAPVGPFLARVSHRLAEQAGTFDPEVANFTRYALDNRGKQLRPALVGLAGSAVGELGERHISAAIVVEMIHLATLVHDDIMDEATVRRRRPTLAAKWGNEVAVLVGDCLFSHALGLATEFDSLEVCRGIADSARRVCSGEILQTLRRQRWAVSRAEYFRVVEMKTAELFALACDLGARLSSSPEEHRLALRAHGLALGVAYQIYDDCVDLFGSEGSAGKSLGTDLATGKLTLPLLIFLERATEADRREFIGWLEAWEPGHFVGVRALLEQYAALEESKRVLEQYLADSRQALEVLPKGKSVEALTAMGRFLSAQTAEIVG